MSGRTWEEFEQNLDNSVGPLFIFAQYLHKKSLTIEIPGLKKRGKNGVPNNYKDNGDLFIIQDDGRKVRIEVKGINTEFTCREDFPYKYILISSKETVERVRKKVSRWVVLAKDRQHFASIHKNTQATWFEVELWASNARQKEKFYAAPLDAVEWHKIGD